MVDSKKVVDGKKGLIEVLHFLKSKLDKIIKKDNESHYDQKIIKT